MLYVFIAIVASIVYLFVGSIVVCLVTDEYDPFDLKFILAIFWPIALIVYLLWIADPIYALPRKIANWLEKIFTKDKEDE